MVTIITILKENDDYRREYAEILAERVKKYSGLNLHILDDRSLRHNWPGWWSKLEVFRFKGPCLYLDLSTLPVGDMTPLLHIAKTKDFVVVRDFNPHLRNVQSCLMTWKGDISHIYRAFAKEAGWFMRYCTTREHWGDQGAIELLCGRIGPKPEYFQDLLPKGSVVSYKKDINQNLHNKPDNVIVVSYHGKPKWWATSDFKGTE